MNWRPETARVVLVPYHHGRPGRPGRCPNELAELISAVRGGQSADAGGGEAWYRAGLGTTARGRASADAMTANCHP